MADDQQQDELTPRRVGDLLIELGAITEQQLKFALGEQKRTGVKLGNVLIDLGFASEESISRALASQSGVEHFDLESMTFDQKALRCVPEDVARRHILVPLQLDKDKLLVAMANPADIMAIDEIERTSDVFVEAGSASRRQILRALDRAYSQENGGRESAIEAAIRRASQELSGEPEADEAQGGIIALVEELIFLALRRDATDLHIEPDKKVIRARLRIDGQMVQGPTLDTAMLPPIVARVKILASLDIAETRVPQDGKIRLPYQGRQIDLRVSTFPCVNGESVVIRILDTNRKVLTVENIGLSDRQVQILQRAARKPNGLILTAGPTGSGKTTTLYALLRSIDTGAKKVVTLEDPVEYELPMSAQCQINEKAGLTFATGLRSILRHDPDVILVGEMRDQETCQMAFRAALTGHLVLSTIHTNDAIRTTARLRDIGVEAFLVASCLAAVCAQRLVRQICPHCRTMYVPRPDELEAVGLPEDTMQEFARGEGCDECHHTGTKGREALFEVLDVTPAVAAVIGREGSNDELEDAARESGFVPFREQALEKAFEGSLSLEEVARVTGEA